MSKENPETKLIHSNDAEKSDSKHKSWIYPDTSTNIYPNKNRNCCSPVDEIEELAKEDTNLNTTHSVEVQTDKSTLYLLKQEKKTDIDPKKINILPINNKELQDDKQKHFLDPSKIEFNSATEFENIKQTENYEKEKINEKLSDNIDNKEIYNEYIETDLDQPMDYTLCYNETNLDEERKGNATFLTKSDFLCIEEPLEEDKIHTVKQKSGINKESTRIKKEMFSNTSRSFKEIFNFFKDRDKKRATVENAKTTTLEGTKILKSAENYEQKVERSSQPLPEQCEKETKPRSDIQYSQQQTPLMFSRCSSLGSINRLEQNSMNDDRSSIVSDVSRRTSGIISPSEVPDSPAQTIPPINKLQQRPQINSFMKKKIQIQNDKLKACQYSTISNENSCLHTEIPLKKPIAKGSVFEDHITSFKDESTPTKLHSVAASSLSSLTIDDDDDYEILNKLIFVKEKQSITEEKEVQSNRQEPIGESNLLEESSMRSEKTESFSCDKDEDFDEEKDDELTDLTSHEEQLLDKCIRRGIAKWTKQNIDDIKPFSWDVGLTCRATRAILISRIRISSDIDVYNHIDDNKESCENDKAITNNISNFKHKLQNEIEEYKSNENNEKFANENSGQTESNSKEFNDQFDKNSYYITYEEHLLDQCIRRGMAKITKRNINDIKPFSWDARQICLTTRAMMLRSCDRDFRVSH